MHIFSKTNQIRQILWQVFAILACAIIFGFTSNMIQKQSLPLVGDWSTNGRMTTETGDSLTISLADAEKIFNKKSVIFIDARNNDQFRQGHIKGALSLPWHDVDTYINDILNNIQPTDAIIIYCDGETCSLSHDLALFLRDMGFENVKVLVNGWTLWKKKDLPVGKQK